jgi:hypothetical protein
MAGDERRRELGKEAPYQPDFMNATAMMNIRRIRHSLTGMRGVCMLPGRLCMADRKYRFCAQTATPCTIRRYLDTCRPRRQDSFCRCTPPHRCISIPLPSFDAWNLITRSATCFCQCDHFRESSRAMLTTWPGAPDNLIPAVEYLLFWTI